MNVKPILFNTAMVQAILSGQKTTTRRIIKDVDNNYTYLGSNKQKKAVSFARNTTRLLLDIKVPYKAGDILYVRETWMIQSMKNFEKNIKFLYKAEPQELKEVHVSSERYEELIKFESKNGWQPSLFMPKEAARIFLKVTDVRVERLQDIDYEGCKNEGVKAGYDGWLGEWKSLWDSTVNKKDIDMYGWNANPYVWVIEFEKIDKSEVEQQ